MIDLFDKIAKHGSPRDKLILLKAHPGQEELKTVLRLALDPFITFGITDFPDLPFTQVDPYLILNQLASRELTGSRAKVFLGGAAANEPELFRRIIRKDLRCGLGAKLVNQLYPGLVRTFDVMRAGKFHQMGRGSYHIERKLDGLRCLTLVEGDTVTLLSRNGLEFTSSDHLKPYLAEATRKYGNCIMDGELISGNFNQSSSAVRKKSEQNSSTEYHVFDILSPEEWRNPMLTYAHRRMHLEALPMRGPVRLVESYPVKTEAEVMKFYEFFRNEGFEGAILKSSSGLYQFKRSNNWLKLKATEDVDLPVESLVQGEGKYYGMLGAVIVKFNGKRVNVGSGFSDVERKLFWENPNLLRGKTIEIQYHQITPDGSLRHPRFVKVRTDKS